MEPKTKKIIIILSTFLLAIGFALACKGSTEPPKAYTPDLSKALTSEPPKALTSEPLKADTSELSKAVTSESSKADTSDLSKAPTSEPPKTDTIQMGMFEGRLSYDSEEGYYFIEVLGARFPFKTDPREALQVPLEAPGEDALAKHSALLLGMMGEGVLHTTILINPDEEEEVMPAVTDLALYIQIVNPKKFAGVAYTKPGGKMEKSVREGPQIQSLQDATPETTIVQITGPKSGAQSTAVRVLGGGKFIVEGETYEETWKAADFVSVTLLKMLCGSPDCPDPAACATGGDCGC